MRGLLVVALLAQVTVPGRTLEFRPGDKAGVPVNMSGLDPQLFPPPSCEKARAEAIERVREAWAPRPPKPDPNTIAMTVVGAGDACWQQCAAQECGIPCDLRRISSRCLGCMAEEQEKAEAKAKEQADREAKARAALDAVDAACGEPKP